MSKWQVLEQSVTKFIYNGDSLVLELSIDIVSTSKNKMRVEYPAISLQ